MSDKIGQKRMLDILDAVWKDCYQKEFEAIHAAIKEREKLKKVVGKWKKMAREIHADVVPRDGPIGILFYMFMVYEFIRLIRDFRLDGKEET